MKKIIMIHGINDTVMKKIYKINNEAIEKNEEVIFTFDDGLYTQYKYRKELDKIKFQKLFFISLNIIRESNLKAYSDFILCKDAHDYFFNNYKTDGRKYFMSFEEIKELSEMENNFIGLHGFNHLEIISRGKYNTPIVKKYGKKLPIKLKKNIKKFIEIDILRMFKKINSLDPELKVFKPFYCYPYNNENLLSEILLQKYSKEYFNTKLKFYGKKRINICQYLI